MSVDDFLQLTANSVSATVPGIGAREARVVAEDIVRRISAVLDGTLPEWEGTPDFVATVAMVRRLGGLDGRLPPIGREKLN